MGTRLGEIDEYFSPGLELTVRGREYTVPLPSAELGLWCQRIAAATGALHEASSDAEMQAAVDRIRELPDLDGRDLTLPQRLLGATYDQMVADQVQYPYIEYCGQTAYIWIIAGEDAAKRYWTSGGHPEAVGPTPNRAERRATGESRTDAAESTPRPGSTSGTTSPPTSRKRGRGRGSRGRRSSGTGR